MRPFAHNGVRVAPAAMASTLKLQSSCFAQKSKTIRVNKQIKPTNNVWLGNKWSKSVGMFQIPLIHSLEKQAKTDADRRLKFHSHLSICLCHPDLAMKKKSAKIKGVGNSTHFPDRQFKWQLAQRQASWCTQTFPPVRPESCSVNPETRPAVVYVTDHLFSFGYVYLRISLKCVIPTLATIARNVKTGRRCFTTLKTLVK